MTLAAVLEAAGSVTVAMQPLGFRFDEDAVLLDGTAHQTDCPLVPVPLPRDAVRLCAGEVLRAQRCPRECICAAPFETLLSFQLVATTSSNSVLASTGSFVAAVSRDESLEECLDRE